MWFDWDWNIPGVTLPLLLLLGVAAGLPKARHAEAGERQRGSKRSWPSIAIRVAAVGVSGIALAWVCVHAVRPWNAQDETDAALTQAASGKKGDLAAAARKADDAVGADPNAVEPLYAAASIAERRQHYRAEGRYLDRLAQRDPDSAQTWLRIARFDLLINDRPGALQALRRFLALDPHANFASYSGFISDFGSFLGDSAAASATATGTPLPKAVKAQPAAPPPAAPSGGATPGAGGTGSSGAGAGGGTGTGAGPGSGQ
jgi:hypothetical protein